jgi:hypothetical protein
MNLVEVEGKGLVSIASLQIGDKVRAGNGRFSRIYSFAHNDPVIEIDYLRIFSQGQTIPFEVSREHLVYMTGLNTIVRASQVQVGDKILDDTHIVERIQLVKRRGAYAPMTESGSIVVSGIRASSYVGLLDQVTPRIHHMVLHAASSTRRIVCSFHFAMCQQETYIHGIADWITPFIWIVQVLDKVNGWFQMMSILIIILPVTACLYLLEQILQHCSPCLLLVLLGILGCRFVVKVRTKSKKQKKRF